jgi:hypothetical protein
MHEFSAFKARNADAGISRSLQSQAQKWNFHVQISIESPGS